MERYKLFGLPVDSILPEELYKKILQLSELNRPTRVILLDTYLVMKAQFNKEIFGLIKSADIVLPISPGIKFGLKFLEIPLKKVYNYFSFLISLLLYFSEENKFIYVLGGKKNMIEKIDINLKDSFPGIRIVGKYHMQYPKSFEKDLITAINKATPALILVGNRSPKQEKWIFRMKNKFERGIFIGVGDFINIIGGKGRSPSDKSVQTGLHGVKKLVKNPLKFYRIFYYLLFIPLLLIYKISGKR